MPGSLFRFGLNLTPNHMRLPAGATGATPEKSHKLTSRWLGCLSYIAAVWAVQRLHVIKATQNFLDLLSSQYF